MATDDVWTGCALTGAAAYKQPCAQQSSTEWCPDGLQVQRCTARRGSWVLPQAAPPRRDDCSNRPLSTRLRARAVAGHGTPQTLAERANIAP